MDGDNASDIAVLRTAASIENLAAATYRAMLARPFVGGAAANPVIRRFVDRTAAHHVDHARAFDAAVARLGGRRTAPPEPRHAPAVRAAAGKITGLGDVVALAVMLEDIAAQTYTHDIAAASSRQLRELFASVAAVEAQHRSVLLVLGALPPGTATATTLPSAASLPAAAGGAGFPDAFYPTRLATPPVTGGVR